MSSLALAAALSFVVLKQPSIQGRPRVSVKLAKQEDYFSSMHDSQSRATEQLHNSNLKKQELLPEFGKQSNTNLKKDYLDENDLMTQKKSSEKNPSNLIEKNTSATPN